MKDLFKFIYQQVYQQKKMNKKKEKPEAPATLGVRLQGLLDKYSLSPERLATLSGISSVQIRAIMSDKSSPYKSTIEKISKSLGTSFEYLQFGEGEDLPNGKIDLNASSESKDGWRDEAWALAKEQLEKKDAVIDRLAVSFDRLTDLMVKMEVNFLHPVRETGS